MLGSLMATGNLESPMAQMFVANKMGGKELQAAGAGIKSTQAALTDSALRPGKQLKGEADARVADVESQVSKKTFDAQVKAPGIENTAKQAVTRLNKSNADLNLTKAEDQEWKNSDEYRRHTIELQLAEEDRKKNTALARGKAAYEKEKMQQAKKLYARSLDVEKYLAAEGATAFSEKTLAEFVGNYNQFAQSLGGTEKAIQTGADGKRIFVPVKPPEDPSGETVPGQSGRSGQSRHNEGLKRLKDPEQAVQAIIQSYDGNNHGGMMSEFFNEIGPALEDTLGHGFANQVYRSLMDRKAEITRTLNKRAADSLKE